MTFLLDADSAAASLMRTRKHRAFTVLRHSSLLATGVTSLDHASTRPKSRPKNRFNAVIQACMAMLKPFTGTDWRSTGASPRDDRPISSAIHLAKLLISTLVTS